jgi:phage/plasmid-associated DNA primase
MLADLAGKLVNIVDEDESEYVSGGKLKALVSFRAMNAQRKYQQSFRFVSHARQVYASNQLPALKGADQAVKRRLYFFEYKHRIPQEKVDPFLTDKILANELPGIVGKAIAAATNFLKNKQVFTIPPLALETREEFMLASSSALAFFDENYKVDDTAAKISSDLHEEYVEWCKRTSRHAMTPTKFHLALKDIEGLRTFRKGGVRVKNCRSKIEKESFNAQNPSL